MVNVTSYSTSKGPNTWRLKGDRRAFQTWRIKGDEMAIQTRRTKNQKAIQTWRVNEDWWAIQTRRVKWVRTFLSQNIHYQIIYIYIYIYIYICWCPFFESIPKSPYGGKSNEKQGPKTHQEDWRARKVQRKKCKRKRSTAKRRSVADYKFAAEYSFSVKWLWQIKANWAQDPFDPTNIIWPTKAQILLYKR